jgi:ATP-dependent 26S proteasome regulatory subunit
MFAIREEREHVTQADFEQAITKVLPAIKGQAKPETMFG